MVVRKQGERLAEDRFECEDCGKFIRDNEPVTCLGCYEVQKKAKQNLERENFEIMQRIDCHGEDRDKINLGVIKEIHALRESHQRLRLAVIDATRKLEEASNTTWPNLTAINGFLTVVTNQLDNAISAEHSSADALPRH